ncbi:uncharacterized protein [Bactrocera oleae]|uniref:uncharacterized protein n=1 Tax=Bactrocera oleae TaxID=104688 RepID=UPI00387E81DD
MRAEEDEALPQQKLRPHCYLTPSDPISEFQAKLDAIEDAAHHPNRHLIIAGDFNAKAMEWSTPTTNSRGRKILDMAARLGLGVANRGSQTTFRRPGCNDTTPDITLVSEGFANQLREWKVLEDYTGSDHQYISYLIGPDKSQATTKRRGTRKWNLHGTLDSITEACKAAMPKIKGGHPKKAVYWWTDERRNTARRRGRNEMEEHKEYKAAKTELKDAIIKAKKDKWEELRSDINKNHWGLGYKIIDMDTEMHSTPTPTMRSAITAPRLGIMPTAAPRTPAATAPSTTARNSIRASAAVPSPPEAPHRIRCPLCCRPHKLQHCGLLKGMSPTQRQQVAQPAPRIRGANRPQQTNRVTRRRRTAPRSESRPWRQHNVASTRRRPNYRRTSGLSNVVATLQQLQRLLG